MEKEDGKDNNNLASANLSEKYMHGADLVQANLSGANQEGANLQEAQQILSDL